MDIMSRVREVARQFGIDMVGCTGVYGSEFIRNQIGARVSREMDTEFDSMDIEDRIYPSRILEGWKSIISFGLSYNFRVRDSGDGGLLSRCSLGVDYHRVLRSKIEGVMRALSQDYELKYALGVDTTPLLDREIARLSGIGYQGKNTNLINKSYGSFIFLGYALVDMEIKDYSYNGDEFPKSEGECGKCDLCQRACPTSSINGDYTINSRRCLAYITQTKSKISYDLRYKIGNRIYGCDTCQEVCPKNRGVVIQSEEFFAPIYVDRNVDLIELATISKREFSESYGKTSSGWRGKNVLRRNALIAMGNSGDKKYLEVLEKLVLDDSDMVAEYAIWAMLNIDFDYGRSLIREIGEKLKLPLRDEAEKIMHYIGGSECHAR